MSGELVAIIITLVFAYLCLGFSVATLAMRWLEPPVAANLSDDVPGLGTLMWLFWPLVTVLAVLWAMEWIVRKAALR